MENDVQKTRLRNGVRVITERISSVRSVSIGVWIDVGSRNEPDSINGISHFIEHMHFKGTKNMGALEIARSLEEVGGSINAFTSREQTCYYARIMSSYLPRAIDILGDILTDSTFKPNDLKKEKAVILEEIKDVADSPGEYIHDLIASQVWAKHALGNPIMGNAETVSSMTRKQVLGYINSNYNSQNIVVAATGDVSHRKLVQMVRKSFDWSVGSNDVDKAIPEQSVALKKAYVNDTQQTHVCIAFPSIGYSDQNRFALMGINTLLSGGMSSRLFQTVREDAGLCYTIYSYQEFFKDCGQFCVYFGSDKKHVEQASHLVFKELKRLKKRLLTPTELTRVRDQLKGNLVLSMESTHNRMNRLARQELMLGRYVSLDETCEYIDGITAKQIQDVARQIFDEKYLSICTLGPFDQKQIDRIETKIS